MRRKSPDPNCCRERFPDCLCWDCDPLAWESPWSLPRADGPVPVGEAIDSVLSLLSGRVERRRWAVRALAVMRANGCAPVIADGALRVTMELLPDALREWLAADPANREAVEELLDEENGLRLYDAA